MEVMTGDIHPDLHGLKRPAEDDLVHYSPIPTSQDHVQQSQARPHDHQDQQQQSQLHGQDSNHNTEHNRLQPQQPQQRAKRKRYTSVACNECKRRKIKCNGESPCGRCGTLNYDCIYETSCCNNSFKDSEEFVRMTAQIASLQEQVNALYALVHELRSTESTIAPAAPMTDDGPNIERTHSDTHGQPSSQHGNGHTGPDQGQEHGHDTAHEHDPNHELEDPSNQLDHQQHDNHDRDDESTTQTMDHDAMHSMHDPLRHTQHNQHIQHIQHTQHSQHIQHAHINGAQSNHDETHIDPSLHAGHQTQGFESIAGPLLNLAPEDQGRLEAIAAHAAAEAQAEAEAEAAAAAAAAAAVEAGNAAGVQTEASAQHLEGNNEPGIGRVYAETGS